MSWKEIRNEISSGTARLSNSTAFNLLLSYSGVWRDKKVAVYRYDGSKLGDEVLAGQISSGLLGKVLSKVAGLGAHIVDVKVSEKKQTVQHPCEDGTLITDHVIDQPAEIDINIVMPHEFYGVDKAIEELDNLKKDNALLAVRVNKRIFTRMIITDVSQTANAETYSRQAFGIHFKEIMGGNRSNFSPTEAYDKSKQQKKGAKK